MKVRVSVTKNDIAWGVRYDPTRCPIARAVRRRVRPNVDIRVSTLVVRCGNHYVDLPAKAQAFVGQFDLRTRKPAPMTFTLNIPKAVLRKKAQS